jgi:acyl carrier protein
MRERVVEVMAAVFDLPATAISDDMTLGHTKNWDSLRQMNLILALEEEFAVRFSDDEVIELISVPLIVEILDAKSAT